MTAKPASGAPSAPVTCIGGAVLDHTLRSNAKLIAGTSNPVTGARGHGGVARNVAANLAGLGVPTRLVSALGRETEAQALLANLAAAGTDTTSVLRIEHAATASYVAVLEPDGSLALGLADMAIFDHLTPARVLPRLDASTGWIFADLNLPPETIATLATNRPVGTPLVIDAVSIAKASRLPSRLDGIDLLCLNQDEAAAVLGAVTHPARMARALLDRGASAVLLTLGGAGALVADADGVQAMAPEGGPVVSVTGAGDAAIAGTIAGLRRGWPLERAAAFGMRLAAMTIGTAESVHHGLHPALMEDQ